MGRIRAASFSQIHSRNFHYYLAKSGLACSRWPLLIRQYEDSVAIARVLRRIKQHSGLDLVELVEGVAYPFLFDGIPFVIKFHGAEWVIRHYCQDGPVFWQQVRLTTKMLRAVSGIFSPSRSLADFLSGACGVPRGNIEITPHPFDTRLYNFSALHHESPPFKLTSVGRLERRMGTHIIVRAMPEIWRYEPETHLHLFGVDGNFGKEKIEAEIPESIHQGRIHFEGFVPWDQLVQSYQDADLFVTPSRYENSPLTLVEAMSCGRPLVASDIGGIPELVRPQETGWLVGRDDPEDLCRAIVEALKNSQLRIAYGRKARKIAKRHDVEHVMTRQLKYYEETIKYI